MQLISTIFVIYGVLLAVGGVIGYVRTKSAVSVVAGVLCGAVAIGASLLMHRHPVKGLVAEACISAIVLGIFARRYSKTKKTMPAIPLAVISGAAAVLSVVELTIRHK